MARGARTILRRVTALLDDSEACLSGPLRVTLLAAVEEVHALEEKIATVDGQLRQVADAHPVAARLQTIPGVGVQTATAMVAAVGHIDGFRRGRRVCQLARTDSARILER